MKTKTNSRQRYVERWDEEISQLAKIGFTLNFNNDKQCEMVREIQTIQRRLRVIVEVASMNLDVE